MEGEGIVAMGSNLGRGYPGRNQTMPKTTSVLPLLLILVLGDAMCAFAKSDDMYLLPMPQKSLSNSKNKSMSFTFGLMHAHHKDLSYIEPNLTLSKRIELLVRSGEKRFSYLANQISGKQMNFGKEHLYYEYEAIVKHSPAFLVDLQVGTPSRVVTLEMDTSIDLTWLHCDPCHECQFPGHGGAFDDLQTIIYNPGPSRSYRALSCSAAYCQNIAQFKNKCAIQEGEVIQKCQYSYPAEDRSRREESELNGDISIEKFTLFDGQLQNNTFHELLFGCGSRNKGHFRLSTGVLGLSGRSLSHLSILEQLDISIFWYCLVGLQFFTTEKSPLILGDDGLQNIDPRHLKAFDVLETRTIETKKLYYVSFKYVYINGKILDIPAEAFTLDLQSNGGTIIDSGVPFSYLNSDIFRVVKEAVESSLKDYDRMKPKPGRKPPFEVCYNIKDAGNRILPFITLGFQHQGSRVKMDLPPQNVFVIQKKGQRTIACLAFKEVLPTNDNHNLNAIGAFQQQDFIIIFRNHDIRFNKVDLGCHKVQPKNQGH